MIVIFVLDLVFLLQNDTAEIPFGLLAILRLWRVVRVANSKIKDLKKAK